MAQFFWNLADSIERFFKTPVSVVLGVVFIIIIIVLVLYIQKYSSR